MINKVHGSIIPFTLHSPIQNNMTITTWLWGWGLLVIVACYWSWITDIGFRRRY